MREVVIVDGMRTAFGRMGGALRPFTPVQLAGMTIKGLCEKTDILNKGKVDAVFAGSASGDVNTHNFARYASLIAGLPYETSATFIEMQCGSSIACINNAALQIQAGIIDVAICGGAEAHSQDYYKFPASVEPYKDHPPTAAPRRLAPTDEDNMSMIEISDGMAVKWGITREQCDEFALRSQQRAAAAMDKGYFKDEIMPVEVKYTKKGETVIVDTDEHPRANTTLEGLAKLRPVNAGGVTTAGNASGMNDASSGVILMSEEKAKEVGAPILARIVSVATTGVRPEVMGIGPISASQKALKKAGLTIDDIDLFEINEAFASQCIACAKTLRIDEEKLNVNGSGISLGHPVGATGSRLVVTLLHELKRRGGKYGLASLCAGGGMGTTVIIEVL